MTLLNYIGFDVVFFVPTGYMSVERYYAKVPFPEHQIGEYKYDLTMPDLSKIKEPSKGFFGGLFGKK